MAGQDASGGSEVQSALALGWVIADLFYSPMPSPNPAKQSPAIDLPSPSDLRPMDACRGKLDHGEVLASRLGVDVAKQQWDASRTVLDAALANQHSESWATGLRDLHVGLLLAFEANDAALYHGYDLGRSLRKTCRLPADVEALKTTFGQWRIAEIQERLGDLTDHLPAHSANAVAASIGVWATWSEDEASPAETRVTEARQRITRQGHLWLAVLTGEKDATGMLDPENFIAASKRLSSQLAKVTSRLLVTYLWQVILLALAIAFVIVTVIVSGKTASVLAALGTLAAALGITRKGVVAEGEGVAKRLADDLWDSELDLSIGEALTKLPRVKAGLRGQKEVLPAPIERIPASGPDPPRLPQTDGRA